MTHFATDCLILPYFHKRQIPSSTLQLIEIKRILSFLKLAFLLLFYKQEEIWNIQKTPAATLKS
jgi:hypothetical protein